MVDNKDSMLVEHSITEGDPDPVDQTVDALHQLGVEVLAPSVEDSDGLAQLWKSHMDYAYGDFIQARCRMDRAWT